MKIAYSDTHVNTQKPKVSQIRNVAEWASAEALSVLKEMWLDGKSATDISRALGDMGISKSRMSIIGKARRMGLGAHPDSREAGRSFHARTEKKKQRRARQGANARLVLPPPEPLPIPHIDDVARVQLQDLTPTMCKWPVGDPKTANFGFCGCEKPRGVNTPYCAGHQSRAWVKARGAI